MSEVEFLWRAETKFITEGLPFRPKALGFGGSGYTKHKEKGNELVSKCNAQLEEPVPAQRARAQ